MFVGRMRSFLRMETLPSFYFFTEEMFTTRFLASSTRDLADG